MELHGHVVVFIFIRGKKYQNTKIIYEPSLLPSTTEVTKFAASSSCKASFGFTDMDLIEKKNLDSITIPIHHVIIISVN